MYSNKPAISIMVRDMIKENRLDQPEGRRHLNNAGLQAVDFTANEVASAVDELLGKQWNRKMGELIQLEIIDPIQPEGTPEPAIASCACGSGIPIQNVIISGEQVTLVGLPLIFQQFKEAGKTPTETNVEELMDTIRIYNPIPSEAESAYKDGIGKAYRNYWFSEKDR
jgi:hypothetical protein